MPRKAAPAAKTPTAALESLGAPRLAALVMELAAGNPAIQRRLKLELAAARSPAEMAREIGKRLQAIARARTYLDRRALRALLAELDGHRRAAAERIAPADPAAAQDLLWQMLGLAESLHNRGDDSNGEIGDALRQALETLGQVAAAAPADPAGLAQRVLGAVQNNGYGEFDRIITHLAPALGDAGLAALKQHLAVWRDAAPPAGTERRAIGISLQGPIYIDAADERRRTVGLALEEIADVQGDVDAFAAQYTADELRNPGLALDVVERLLAAGRVQDAWALMEAADQPPEFDVDWELLRVEALDGLGRTAEAQALRWACFEDALLPDPLRAHLKRLPDFDDVEAEDRALAYVQGHRFFLPALQFLLSWPALDRAAAMVLARAGELDGNYYEILTPAAAALSGRHPLAATLALRAMIDFTLGKGRSSRYGHAARHLLECESLAAGIRDWGTVPPHDAYLAALKKAHNRKPAFWNLLR